MNFWLHSMVSTKTPLSTKATGYWRKLTEGRSLCRQRLLCVLSFALLTQCFALLNHITMMGLDSGLFVTFRLVQSHVLNGQVLVSWTLDLLRPEAGLLTN